MADNETLSAFELFSQTSKEAGEDPLSLQQNNDFDITRRILPFYEGDFVFRPLKGDDPWE